MAPNEEELEETGEATIKNYNQYNKDRAFKELYE